MLCWRCICWLLLIVLNYRGIFMAKLSEIKGEVIRAHGLPYFERMVRANRGGSNWNCCTVCGQWVQGICKSCQSCGKLVKPLGVGAFDSLK